MVKTVLSSARQGLKDWIIQRVSALVMAFGVVGLLVYFCCHPGITYSDWRGFFSYDSVKIAAVFVLASMLWHAWIGIWTIFTDYVKCAVLRAGLNLIVLLMLAACFIWGLIILWSV